MSLGGAQDVYNNNDEEKSLEQLAVIMLVSFGYNSVARNEMAIYQNKN